MFAAALPLMLIGIYFGDRIHVRLSEMTFSSSCPPRCSCAAFRCC